MRIVVERAALSYGGEHPVFADVDASFDEGRITALVGPSGSGKTSLLSAIAGITRLSAGTVSYVDGGDHRPPAREDIVWVPQGSNAIGSRSAIDNVMIGPLSNGIRPADARELALAALAGVGLEQRAHSPANKLSGGELQRVGFARALASRRPVILADEPSSSLDAQNTEQLAELLRDLSTEAIVIVATHDPLLMEAADDIVRLR